MTDTPVSDAPPLLPTAAPAPRALAQLWVWLALLLAVLAMVTTVVLWQRLSWTQQELARRSTDATAQASEARHVARQSGAEVQALQAKLALAEARLAEVALQRTQLEELMLSVSRSRDDNLVQDLEAGIRLAHQQSDLTGSAQPLIVSLQSAAQRIERSAQPRLNTVLRAIERDLERLRASQIMDVPSLVQRLDQAAQRLDTLPLANAVPRPPAVAPASGAAAEPVVREGLAGVWDRWRTAVLNEARSLLRVSRIDRPEASLIAPDQAYFLRGNLRLLLLNARIGVLARQPAMARADLQRVQNLLERFFDVQAADTKALLQLLDDVLQDVADTALPRPDDSLTALAAAAAGR